MQTLGFLADFLYRMWLIERPIDLPDDSGSQLRIRRSYWDVVYHRTSADGLELTGRRQGLFHFSFIDGHPGWIDPNYPPQTGLPLDAIQVHAAYANCFALCYHSALQSIHNADLGYFFVGPRDFFHIRGGAHPVGAGPRHRLAGYSEESLPVGLTGIEVLDTAFASFEEFHKHGISVVHIAAMLNQAAYSLQWHNLNICLTIAWTVSEVLLGKIWSDLTGRRADGTAATMTKDLIAANAIPHELGGELNQVRKARNAWLHTADEPNVEAARLAVVTAQEMTRLALNIFVELEKEGSAQVWGGHYW